MKEIKMYQSFDGKCVGTIEAVRKYEGEHIEGAFKSLYHKEIRPLPYNFDGNVACVTVVKCETPYDYDVLVEYAMLVNRETERDQYKPYGGVDYYVLIEEECGWGDIIPIGDYRSSFRDFYTELCKF